MAALAVRIDDAAESANRSAMDATLAIFEQKTRDSGQLAHRWSLARSRAALAMLEGRFAAAEEGAREALALGRGVVRHSSELDFARQLFQLRAWQGRLAEIEPLIEQKIEATRVIPAWRCAIALLYAFLGKPSEARREIAGLLGDDASGVPRDAAYLLSLSLLADAAHHVDDVGAARQLYRALLPHAGRLGVSRPLVVVGSSIDERLGKLALVVGDYEAAERHLGDARLVAERMRALPWQAEVHLHRGELRIRRGRVEDRDDALRYLDAAEAIAAGIGQGYVTEAVARWRATAEDVFPKAPDASRPPPRKSASDTDGPDPVGEFRRAGSLWCLGFEGRTQHYRAMRGLEHLARLLGDAGREWHVLDLAAAANGARPTRPVDLGDAGEALDPEARRQYTARLKACLAEREEAEGRGQADRVEKLDAEIDWLRAEVSRAFGLAGARRIGSDAERARVAVTRAIKYALDKIQASDPPLAEHLRTSVRTGTFCAYQPTSRDRVAWRL